MSNDDLVRHGQRGMQGLRSHLVHARRVSARGHKQAIVKRKCILPLTESTCRPFKMPQAVAEHDWLPACLPVDSSEDEEFTLHFQLHSRQPISTMIQDELFERVTSCFPYRALKLILVIIYIYNEYPDKTLDLQSLQLFFFEDIEEARWELVLCLCRVFLPFLISTMDIPVFRYVLLLECVAWDADDLTCEWKP